MRQYDIERLKQLGLAGYIQDMTIQKVLPDLSLPILSKSAKQKLKWMDYYRDCQNASQTCRYFGTSRKTFHKWYKRYDPRNLLTLEEVSRKPNHLRRWQVTREEESRILALRKKYIRYGKEKLKVIYHREYNQEISSWKVQRVIEKHQLYYSPVKNYRLQARKRRNQPKKRITELTKQAHSGFLIALDTIVIYAFNLKRYILTGIDVHSKIAFARMYPGHGSAYAADFLKRMHYLLNGKIENIQTDNGSEFAKYFERAAQSLSLPHYYSRPRTPNDNPFDERFNRTLQEEFIALGHLTDDCAIFNKNLTEWLVEYNFHRPHQSLDYLTPVEFNNQYLKVLPMYPAST